jgi:hypothetical protein
MDLVPDAVAAGMRGGVAVNVLAYRKSGQNMQLMSFMIPRERTE